MKYEKYEKYPTREGKKREFIRARVVPLSGLVWLNSYKHANVSLNENGHSNASKSSYFGEHERREWFAQCIGDCKRTEDRLDCEVDERVPVPIV